MKISTFLVAFGSLLCVSAKSSAQTVDTVQLKVIAISEDRSMVFSKGNFISVIDSSSVASSPHQSIAELLSANSSSFIKTYSFGGSATISSRGTEARHNVVLWNGFNINSSSLGLSDLSLIPSFISDEITLLHGGSGPVNGNSALGSTIILGNTDPEFLKKNRIGVNIETGSFGKYLGSFMYKTENKYASSKTILFYNQAENNFEFVNFTNREKPVVKQKNASYKNYGILQNLDFKLNQKSILSFGLWYQVYDRELPPIMTSEHSYASQRDSNLRVTLGYKIILARSVLKIKGAIFSEFQFYDDSKLNYHNKYQVTNYLSELEWRWSIHDKLIFNSGCSYINSVANFDEYATNQNRKTLSLFTGFLYQPFHDWNLNFNLRKEFTNIENPPIAPSLGLEGTIIKNTLFVFGNIGRHYNLPTMNDLYWRPGGNENLKPEDSWSEELGIILTNKNNSIPKLSVTAFNSLIDNWIKWQPGAAGIYAPNNLRQVHTNGIEMSLHFHKEIKKLQLQFNVNYTWCNSSISKTQTPQEEATINKQLIYVPVNVLNSVLVLKYAHFSLNYNHTFNGERFVTADNSASLEPFQVANITIEKEIISKKFNIHLYTKIMNLYDVTYQVLAYRPMPGRWFSLGIKFDLYLNK